MYVTLTSHNMHIVLCNITLNNVLNVITFISSKEIMAINWVLNAHLDIRCSAIK